MRAATIAGFVALASSLASAQPGAPLLPAGNGILFGPKTPAVPVPILLESFDSATLNGAGASSIVGNSAGNSGSPGVVSTNKVQGTGAIRALSTGFGGTQSFTKTNVQASIDPATLGTVALYTAAESPYYTFAGVNLQLGRGGTYYGTTSYQYRSDSTGIGRWVDKHVSELLLNNSGTPMDAAGLGVGQLDFKYSSSLASPFVQAEDIDALIGNARGTPTVIFVFDDGYSGQYLNLLPLMQKYGIKAAFAPTKTQAGNGGYLSVANMQAMIASGLAVIVPDGRDDDADMTSAASLSAAMTNLNSVRDWITGTIGGDPYAAKFVVYPFGISERSTRVSTTLNATSGSGAVTVGAATGISAGQTLQTHPSLFPATTKVSSIVTTTVTADQNALATSSSFTGRFVFTDDTNAPFYGSKLTDAMKAAGYLAARTTSATDSHVYSRFGIADQAMVLPSASITSTTTTQNIQDEITKAELRGDTVLFYGHNVITGATSTGNDILVQTLEPVFQRIRSDVANGLLTNPFWHEWYLRDCANPASLPF